MGILSIEDALISHIKTALGNKVRKVDSLPADFDAETVRRMLVDAPAVYVAFGAGSSPGARSGTTAEILARWGVFAVTAHASGQAARRRGDSQQIGAYELLEILIPLLHGFTIPGEGTLSLTAVENLFNGEVEKKGLSVYSAVFQMPMIWSSDADLSLLTPFQTFAVQLDIPPFETEAERRKWLAENYTTSTPDAKDNVTLPQ